MAVRSLAERLASLRTERAHVISPRPVADRAETLARWFDARLTAEPGGTVLLVERRVALPPGVALALGHLPRGCYFDTETTGLSTGAGTVIFLAGLAWLEANQVVVRQFLLPDYPHEAALLRNVAAELAGAERVITYNGRAFDLPMLASRLTVHRRHAAVVEDHQVPAAQSREVHGGIALRRQVAVGRESKTAALLGGVIPADDLRQRRHREWDNPICHIPGPD